jgi:Fe-S cluster assembly protein SufD
MDKIIYRNDLKEKLLADFAELEKKLNGKSSSPLHQVRKAAIQRFAQLGFPTIRNEEWKYTNLKPLLEQAFEPAFQLNDKDISLSDIVAFAFPETDVHRLVFVDGWYSKELSSHSFLEESNIIVENLSSAMDIHTELLEKYLIIDPQKEKESMVVLNTAYALDGAFVYVPSNTEAKKPIHLLHINSKGETPRIGQARNIIVAGKNSKINIIESYHSISDKPVFTNNVTDFYVDENAFAGYYKLQDENRKAFHTGHLRSYLKKNANFSAFAITLGGRLIRNSIEMTLDAENCNGHMYGLYILDGKQHVDNHTLVDHAMPHSFSNELYKGILDEFSTAVFNGKIVVRPDAQKTNAYQSSKHILVSDDANVYAKPQLEIYADDVKCSHGATTGQVDEDAVFYLRARGLSLEQSKALMNYAFVMEVVEAIDLDVFREKIDALVKDKLHKDF